MPICGILDIHVISGENIDVRSGFGFQDMYARFACGESSSGNQSCLQTKIIKSPGSSPVFNQKLQIGIPEGGKKVTCELFFASHTKGNLRDELIGYFCIDLLQEAADKNKPIDFLLITPESALRTNQTTALSSIKLKLCFHKKTLKSQTSIFESSCASKVQVPKYVAPILQTSALSVHLKNAIANIESSKKDSLTRKSFDSLENIGIEGDAFERQIKHTRTEQGHPMAQTLNSSSRAQFSIGSAEEFQEGMFSERSLLPRQVIETSIKLSSSDSNPDLRYPKPVISSSKSLSLLEQYSLRKEWESNRDKQNGFQQAVSSEQLPASQNGYAPAGTRFGSLGSINRYMSQLDMPQEFPSGFDCGETSVLSRTSSSALPTFQDRGGQEDQDFFP